MGFVSLKIWLITLLTVVGLLFVTGSWWVFGLYWNPSPMSCLEPYVYRYENWHTLKIIGHVELRYKPAERHCDSFEYNPKEGYKPIYR